MNSIIRYILIFLFLIVSGSASAELTEDKSLRIKRAFYESTGIHWYDASKEVQETFMEKFNKKEEARIRTEQREEKKIERLEKRKIKAKERAKKNIEREERNAEREEKRIHKEKERQLKAEKRRMERMQREFDRKRRQK